MGTHFPLVASSGGGDTDDDGCEPWQPYDSLLHGTSLRWEPSPRSVRA